METETKPRLTFDAPTHTYTIDGKPAIGVTEALTSVGLINPRWYPEEARRRGAFVHAASVLLDENDLHWPSVPEEWAGYLRSWQVFKDRMRLSILAVEQRVYDPLYMVAGTLDRIVQMGGSMVLLDLKTVGLGKGAPHFATRYQVAGYSGMYRREHKGQSFRLGAVVLQADGSLPRWTEYTDDSDWSAFLAIVETAKILRRHGHE